MFFVWFHSDFTDVRADGKRRGRRQARRREATAERDPVTSEAVGRGRPGALVGGGVNSLKRLEGLDGLDELAEPTTDIVARRLRRMAFERPAPDLAKIIAALERVGARRGERPAGCWPT